MVVVATYPLETDFAAVAHGQGAGKGRPAGYSHRADDSTSGDIHHIDGGAVPSIAPTV